MRIPVTRYLSLRSVSLLERLCAPIFELGIVSPESIELDLRQANKMRRPLRQVREALGVAERSYFECHVGYAKNNSEARLHRKIFDSLRYFRKSFIEYAREEEKAVNLAIAFEVLLTDHYSGGVYSRICRRARIAMGRRPKKELVQALTELYKVRCQTLHDGRARATCDILSVQRAYVFTFVGLLSRIKKSSETEVGRLLGDEENKTSINVAVRGTLVRKAIASCSGGIVPERPSKEATSQAVEVAIKRGLKPLC